MRVTPEQINVFDVYARRYFGEDAGLWLFGSRVDESKKDGDYDFLVETTLSDADEIIERKIALLTKLQGTDQFEDEKIDIVVKRRVSNFDMPIYQVAMHEGVRILRQNSRCVFFLLSARCMQRYSTRALLKQGHGHRYCPAY